MIKRYLEKKLLGLWYLLWSLLLAWLLLVFSFTPSWDSTEDGGYRTRDKCVRKQGGQETFEWLCTDGYVIYLAQSENIIQCFSCFFKKFSDWTWEQEIRRGVREDPKYITCRRYKRRQQEIYDKKIFREKVIGIVVLIIVLTIGLAVLGLFTYSLMGIDRGWWVSN